MLPQTLAQLVGIHLRNGELGTAAALMQEVDAGMEATGSGPSPDLALSLAAYRGREADARPLIEARRKFVSGGLPLVVVQWASALLYNGLGRYDDALRPGLQAHDDAEPVGRPPWILQELIEAAAGSGVPEQAADAMRRLSEETRVSGTDWALGLEARSRALLSRGDEAERLYREAIGRLAGPGSRVDLARAHLLYGEWLRREGRRTDAREQLRTAHEMFVTMGTEAFAERAERELLAGGETTRKRVAETSGQLTPQETQIARFARDGLSNAEIGARLFISPRTVQYHLRKVFTKLGINSRMHLGRVLPHDRDI
jgi:DNA-binding CsgD family transcriptional regulator